MCERDDQDIWKDLLNTLLAEGFEHLMWCEAAHRVHKDGGWCSDNFYAALMELNILKNSSISKIIYRAFHSF